jgi:hypothetical protein
LGRAGARARWTVGRWPWPAEVPTDLTVGERIGVEVMADADDVTDEADVVMDGAAVGKVNPVVGVAAGLDAGVASDAGLAAVLWTPTRPRNTTAVSTTMDPSNQIQFRDAQLSNRSSM